MYEQHPEIQFRSPAEIAEYQNMLLRKQMQYIKGNSPFYQKMFADNHLSFDDIQTTDDLQKLPVTTKQDLQLHNQDLLLLA